MAVNTITALARYVQRHATESSGLSGKPLCAPALAAVERLRSCIGDAPALIAVGGIGSANDAEPMFDAGADLVQNYNTLVYEEPAPAGSLASAAKRCSRREAQP